MDPKGIISHCWFVIWTFEHLSNLLKWSVHGLICVSFAILSTTVRDVYKTSYFYGLITTFCSYARVVTSACYMKCNLFKTKLRKLKPNAFHVCFTQTHRQLDIPFHMFVVCMTMRLFVFCGMGWVVDNVVFCLFYEFFFSVFFNFFKPIDVYVGNF